jgi:hypothetical protein
VAEAVVVQLERDGWIAPSPEGGHLVSEGEPFPQSNATSMLEALWGDAYPVPTGPIERIVSDSIRDLLRPPSTPPSLEALLEAIHGRPVTTYLIGIDGLPFVKIGRTTGNAKARMLNLQCGQPLELSLLGTWNGDFESDLHVHFDAYRVRGEWFDLTPLGDPVDVVKAAVGEIEVSRA